MDPVPGTSSPTGSKSTASSLEESLEDSLLLELPAADGPRLDAL
jgi:hypothetical protein